MPNWRKYFQGLNPWHIEGLLLGEGDVSRVLLLPTPPRWERNRLFPVQVLRRQAGLCSMADLVPV